MLLLLMVTVLAAPAEYITFNGRLASAEQVISLLSIIFPVFGAVALRKITPDAVAKL